MLQQGSTNNLMDYLNSSPDGRQLSISRLYKYQWDLIHDPVGGLFLFQDEEDMMAMDQLATNRYISLTGKGPAFLTPSGVAIGINGITHGLFNEDGGLINFILNGNTFYCGVFDGTQEFLGYVKAVDTSKIKGRTRTAELIELLNELSFKKYFFPKEGVNVFALAKQKQSNNYINCVCEYNWSNQERSTEIKGRPALPIIPTNAIETNCIGSMCQEYEDVQKGVGYYVYLNLLSLTNSEEERIVLRDLANDLTRRLDGKKFALYGYGLEYEGVRTDFSRTALKLFKDEKLKSIEKFNMAFPFEQTARNCPIILSTKDLWGGIDRETYNAVSIDWTSFEFSDIKDEIGLFEALDRLEFIVTEIYQNNPGAISENSYNNILQYIYECTDNPTEPLKQLFNLNQTFKTIYASLGIYERYEYDFFDLRVRQAHEKIESIFWREIFSLESKGAAAPISVSNDYTQYVKYYGTDNAFFLGQQYMSMIGIMYSLYGVQQMTGNMGNALRGIIRQRSTLRTAINQNRLLNTKIEYNSQLARNPRLEQDIKYQQHRQLKHGGRATNTERWQDKNIAKNPVQNQIKNEFSRQLNNIGANDIRINQTHSSATRQALGLNRPDIQFTYNNKRYYIEIDAISSGRGVGHQQRIIANDPMATSNTLPPALQNIRVIIGGQTYQLTGSITLIQLP